MLSNGLIKRFLKKYTALQYQHFLGFISADRHRGQHVHVLIGPFVNQYLEIGRTLLLLLVLDVLIVQKIFACLDRPVEILSFLRCMVSVQHDAPQIPSKDRLQGATVWQGSKEQCSRLVEILIALSQSVLDAEAGTMVGSNLGSQTRVYVLGKSMLARLLEQSNGGD